MPCSINSHVARFSGPEPLLESSPHSAGGLDGRPPRVQTAARVRAEFPASSTTTTAAILRTAPPPHTVESLACALDYLKGTQVDCLCWCVGEQQIAYS